MPGVVRTRAGYTGGTKKDPAYHSLGDHAETVQIDYDPARISYKELLDVFWENHDPTISLWLRQYMSAIFYHHEEQKKLSLETRERYAEKLKSKIVTEIIPFTKFYLAEDYHQKYALQHNYEILKEFKEIYPSFEQIVSSTAAARVNGYLGGYGIVKTLQAEIDSYGLSPEAGGHLFSIVKASGRYQCQRSGPY